MLKTILIWGFVWVACCVLIAAGWHRVAKLSYRKGEDEDMKRKVKIKVMQSHDALRFWVVQVGGNGEVMWRTEEYTRISSAKRAARAQFNRIKKGLAELFLNP